MPRISQLRVMQVMGAGSLGGVEGFFERLVIALHRRSLPQKVVIRANDKIGRADRLRNAGLDVVQLAFGGPLEFWTRLRLRRLANEYRPHIVLTFQNRATAKMPKGDFVHLGRLGGYYPIKNYRHCDYLIGITPDMVRWLVEERGWPEDRAICIPNFASTASMAPCERSTLGTPIDRKLIVAVGRLHENKGFDVLLQALAKYLMSISGLPAMAPRNRVSGRCATRWPDASRTVPRLAQRHSGFADRRGSLRMPVTT